MRLVLRFALYIVPASLLSAADLRTTSPSGQLSVSFQLDDGRPSYEAQYSGRPLLSRSRLGTSLYSGSYDLIGHSEVSRSSVWRPLYGERRDIPNRYHQLTVLLQDRSAPKRQLEITFRAYDEGIALRYRILGDDVILYLSEFTEFQFPEGAVGYEEHGTEGEYKRVPITAIQPGCERPLTVDYGNGMFASLTEAGTVDYPRMLLSPLKGRPGTLISDLGGAVRRQAPFDTPWRLLVVGQRPGDLVERNYLVLNLNPPYAFSETSWIKPGKAMREMTLSTEGGKALVDFAAAHGLDYIEYDAGWYGHEYDELSDATRVSLDRDRVKNIPNHRGLDLEVVIEYARKKDIGVWLYVNRRALERQADEIFPLYRKWGVKGVKFGFVNVGPQEWTSWVHDAIRKAAVSHLMVDIHDSYRPTGYTRTYPNLMTQEGVRGNEHMPTSAHNTTLPFTRFIAGAADYTICYYSNRIKTTRAHQLAMAVVAYSPIQFVFWYDKPSDYRGEPEVDFFGELPTVWDNTRVVNGEIGEYVTIARQKDRDWFVGTINNGTAREFKVPLEFLEPGRKYKARIYENGEGRREVRIREQAVDSSTVLRAVMPPDGGQAVHITALEK